MRAAAPLEVKVVLLVAQTDTVNPSRCAGLKNTLKRYTVIHKVVKVAYIRIL